jgi:hypothetical protein
MGTSTKYGKIMTERGGIPLSEPVFLIRAQDALACPAISAYYQLCVKKGAAQEHLSGVEQAYNAFADWQEAHADQVKTPDTRPGQYRGL